jgi:hypothetical protein
MEFSSLLRFYASTRAESWGLAVQYLLNEGITVKGLRNSQIEAAIVFPGIESNVEIRNELLLFCKQSDHIIRVWIACL